MKRFLFLFVSMVCLVSAYSTSFGEELDDLILKVGHLIEFVDLNNLTGKAVSGMDYIDELKPEIKFLINTCPNLKGVFEKYTQSIDVGHWYKNSIIGQPMHNLMYQVAGALDYFTIEIFIEPAYFKDAPNPFYEGEKNIELIDKKIKTYALI